MKSALIKLSLLILSISLVACSSNTQEQNTGAGAVTGAVVGGLAGSLVGAGTGQVVAIGVGAVAGALIGGSIGHSMDSSDHTHVYQSLETNHPNHATHWRNAHTGSRYTVVPTSGRVTINGNPNCRHFRTTAYIHGEKQHFNGVACRMSDGSWHTMNN